MTFLEWGKEKTQNFKIWAANFILKKQMQVQRGREITEQKRAENMRKKINRIQDAKPSAITTMRRGFMTKANPIEVMREEYDRRKQERESK